jgi:hypothetical protein
MRRALLVLAACVCLTGAAMAQGMSQAVNTGIDAYNRGDYATAFRLLKTAADATDSDGANSDSRDRCRRPSTPAWTCASPDRSQTAAKVRDCSVLVSEVAGTGRRSGS